MNRREIIDKFAQNQGKIEGLVAAKDITGKTLRTPRKGSPCRKTRHLKKAVSFSKTHTVHHPNHVVQEPDPLDPANYKSNKSEFYWKLHDLWGSVPDLTLKVKDYVSNFKPIIKKDPIEELITKAMNNSNKKILLRKASLKKIHKKATLIPLSRCDIVVSFSRRSMKKPNKNACSRDDLVIHVQDCQSQADPYFSYSPIKKMPTTFFSKRVKETPSVSSDSSLKSEIKEDELDNCMTPETVFFAPKDSRDRLESFQKPVDLLSETDGKSVVKKESGVLPPENKFIQRAVVQKSPKDKDAIHENMNNAITLVDMTTRDFHPIQLSSKVRETYIDKVEASMTGSPSSNPSQADATTEARTNLPEIRPRSKL